ALRRVWSFVGLRCESRGGGAGRAVRLVGVVAARLTPFWRFGVVGPVPSPPPRRTVVVSNHESNADPFLISFLPWEMKWLGKASLFRIPVWGGVGWLVGAVRGPP